MNKIGTLFFLAFGGAILGWVVLFALNSQGQFDDLQQWTKDNGWTFERPGDRVSFLISGATNGSPWTVKAIQGDKLATPSLDAKPKTIWRTPLPPNTAFFVIAPPMPQGVYNNPETRVDNQRKLFEYMLLEEASHLNSLVPLESPPEALAEKFTFFVQNQGQGSFFSSPKVVDQLLTLHEQLAHSPILVASPDGISIRAQTMVFGPKILDSLIKTGALVASLVTPKNGGSPLAIDTNSPSLPENQ